MSSSCNKCVKVLRDLISGLQEENNKNEPPPLTLLKAIAGTSTIQQRGGGTAPQQQHQNQLKVEEVEDGIRLTIPVETTLPTLLRRWTKLPQIVVEDDDDNGEDSLFKPLYHAMATSASSSDDDVSSVNTKSNRQSSQQEEEEASSKPIADPLTIELKCRKCASSGPEGGARAFLMGPQPLSVVLCHNRIAATQSEVEEILTHELIHLFDVQTLRLDLQDCENLAYSEVRAAKAAECRDSWKQLQPYCVKQKAISATNNLFPQEGRECIRRVFRHAFADNRPFVNENNANNYRHQTSSDDEPHNRAMHRYAKDTESHFDASTPPPTSGK
jgi:hypothetical protein